MENLYSQYWITLSNIHNKTKELYILSEEYSNELNSFIQPVRELKDAYEHIVRAYSNQYTDNIDENYIKTNFEKAIGHEYRAFFDTADFLSIVLRQKIAERLSQYSLLEIKSVWEEYDEIKNIIHNVPKEIAYLRLQKDIGNRDEISKLVDKYYNVIKKIIEIYSQIELTIYPQLVNKYKK